MNKFLAMATAGAAMTVAGTAHAAVTLTATSVTTVYSGAPTADLHKTNANPKTVGDVRVTPQTLKGSMSTNGGPAVPVEFFAYCVDIFQTAGPTTFTVTSLGDYLQNDTKTKQITALIAAEGAKENKLHDAAVQLAVWELINDLPTSAGNYGEIGKVTQTTTEYYYDSRHRLKSRQVTSTPGQFWVDDVKNGAGVLGMTDAFLDAALAAAGTPVPGLNLFVAKSSTKQDFLFWTYTPVSPPQPPVPPLTPSVPEPASWALMILGFGAVGHKMRGKQRAALGFA